MVLRDLYLQQEFVASNIKPSQSATRCSFEQKLDCGVSGDSVTSGLKRTVSGIEANDIYEWEYSGEQTSFEGQNSGESLDSSA